MCLCAGFFAVVTRHTEVLIDDQRIRGFTQALIHEELHSLTYFWLCIQGILLHILSANITL